MYGIINKYVFGKPKDYEYLVNFLLENVEPSNSLWQLVIDMFIYHGMSDVPEGLWDAMKPEMMKQVVMGLKEHGLDFKMPAVEKYFVKTDN